MLTARTLLWEEEVESIFVLGQSKICIKQLKFC